LFLLQEENTFIALIFNITRTDFDTTRAINTMVGKPFGLLARLKAGRIGSEPFIIEQSSPEFEVNYDVKEYDRTCVLERRPHGIMLHFRIKFSLYVWVIPFTELTILQNGTDVRVENRELNMQLRPRVKTKKPSAFVQVLIAQKSLVADSSRNHY
jgi:hypothetical protein